MGGMASDKQICVESGFLNLLDLYDLVMANRGFAFKEELLIRRTRLDIPLGARARSKWIHVDETINRLKMFKMLKETHPITLLPTIDDSINVITALVLYFHH
ncbi:hypothetical protein ACJMK2_030309 [Sinanodonta woodiana]|uniref:DDE Tnp4 domain-containing protein n=1 Tax=Sinanodonta woodiana TaxID=1069815 RepID=A0ABD3XCT2_SINWO